MLGRRGDHLRTASNHPHRRANGCPHNRAGITGRIPLRATRSVLRLRPVAGCAKQAMAAYIAQSSMTVRSVNSGAPSKISIMVSLAA